MKGAGPGGTGGGSPPCTEKVGGAHGRRGRGPAGPAQVGWALLVIAMALVGGLAAATLVNASLVITVVVSLVIGVVGAAAVLRPPAAGPELTFRGADHWVHPVAADACEYQICQ